MLFRKVNIQGLGSEMFCCLSRPSECLSHASNLPKAPDSGDSDEIVGEFTDGVKVWAVVFNKDGLLQNTLNDVSDGMLEMVESWIISSKVAGKDFYEFKLENSRELVVIKTSKSGFQIATANFDFIEIKGDIQGIFMRALLNSCIAKVAMLETSVRVSNEKLENIKIANEAMKSAIDKCSKNELKQREELITKFGLLLNEKKTALKKQQQQHDDHAEDEESETASHQSRDEPQSSEDDQILPASESKRNTRASSAKKKKDRTQQPMSDTSLLKLKAKDDGGGVPPFFKLDKSQRDPTKLVYAYYKKVQLADDPKTMLEVRLRFTKLPNWSKGGNPSKIVAFLEKHKGKKILELREGEKPSNQKTNDVEPKFPSPKRRRITKSKNNSDDNTTKADHDFGQSSQVLGSSNQSKSELSSKFIREGFSSSDEDDLIPL